MDRPGSVATLRTAVADFARTHLPGEDRWCVALSGGADSLALTAVAAAERHTTALIVDHRLQTESGRVAAHARQQALDVGCVDAQVLCVDVGFERRARGGGPQCPLRGVGRRARRCAGAARAHLGRPGRDGVARARPGLGSPFDRRHARIRSAVVPTAARRAPGGHPCGLRGAGSDALARPAQRRPSLHPGASASRSAAAARGRTRRWCRRGAGPHRRGLARGHRHPRRSGRSSAAACSPPAASLDAAALASLPAAVRRRVIRGWLLGGGAAG